MYDPNVIKHIGIERRSGRYPWGSGERPYQHEDWLQAISDCRASGMTDDEIISHLWGKDISYRTNAKFRSIVLKMKKDGMSETEIASKLGTTTTLLRQKIAVGKAEQRALDSSRAFKLMVKGYSNRKIGEIMGINESSVRQLLDPHLKVKNEVVFNTADAMKQILSDGKYLDLGPGSEQKFGIKRDKLRAATRLLVEDEGYKVYYIKVRQLGTGKYTYIKTLAPPDTSYSEVFKNQEKITVPGIKSYDDGETFTKISNPVSISSKRISIRYAEDGGKEKDGVIELRRGVDDISLGNAKYAQVRIAVDGTHYLKGMAVYSDNLPDGVDILFNTNKHKGTPMLGDKDNSVLKPLKSDPENPFGAIIKDENELILAQRYYTDKNGNKQQSALNIVNEEGTWGTWSRTLSSQFLSKQTPALAKQQLKIAYDMKQEEFDEIMSLTNPTIRKRLLQSFADDCDAAAVHLRAAALPRQNTKVILPVPELKETEIYAPGYENGERVVLIRHPHGGIFEIPELTVNNKNRAAKSFMENARDAVGINAKVAEQLSGADFDGDTVLVIPNPKRNSKALEIKHEPVVAGLATWDNKEAYPAYEGMKPITAKEKNKQMGIISNLITDMTIKGAPIEEIIRADKHSMVIIDSEKHNLDWKSSERDFEIAELKKKYQDGGGVSTLISRAGNEIYRPGERKAASTAGNELKRLGDYSVDPKTGKKVYDYNPDATYEINVKKKDGTWVKETKKAQYKITRMEEVENAHELSSGTLMEKVYGDHANQLKELGNRARKEWANTPLMKYSPSAKKTYAKEVEDLERKLNIAKSNQPLERKAQTLANLKVAAIVKENPGIKSDPDHFKKLKGQSLTNARARVGAGKERILITPREWEAIQAGAISDNKLKEILNNTDLDHIRKYATPRAETIMSPAMVAKANAYIRNGATQQEAAAQLGVSVSTLVNALK